jgi:oligopeptide transport system substrate-binding protein
MLALKLLELLEKRYDRFRKSYDQALLANTLIRTLGAANQTFLSQKSIKQIERLILLQYHFNHQINSDTQRAKTRPLRLKVFRVLSDKVSLLKVAIGTSLHHPHEVLQEKHIYRALVSILPGIKVVDGSFYSCQEPGKTFSFCYLEIEKLRGAPITSHDIFILRKKLPQELEQSIQSLTFSLLFSYNEEELYKSALNLAKELKSGQDLPQVSISFQALVQSVLRFSIVLVRARKKDQKENFQTFQHRFHPLPSSTQITLQKVISMGRLEKNRFREAVIFSIETDCSLFLNKKWSIDLNHARRFIAKLVEQSFGFFRDYNGGLLTQQSKQLEQIKKLLRKKYEGFYPLIQELFQNFSPPSFQALIHTSIAKRLFNFFISFFNEQTPLETVVYKKKSDRGTLFILLKSTSDTRLQALLKEVKALQNESSSTLGCSYFEFEQKHYLCFVDLNPSAQWDVLAHVERALKEKNTFKSDYHEQKVLKLNFQEGDPPCLNPQIAIDQRCRSLSKALFEGLTRINSEGGAEPAAAKEIRISPCQTIYTFILRQHHWSNGEEVTAYDFEEAWKRAIDPNSHSLRSDLFYIIKNAKQAKQGLKPLDEVKIKAVNAKTLVVELEYPAFHFLLLTAHPVFSPIYKKEQEPYHFNGPYLLKEWRRDQFLHLTFNPYYWDQKNVQIKDIHITMEKSAELVCQLFDKGELDWLGEPFTSSEEEVFFLPKTEAWQKKKVSQIYWIYLNTRCFPLFSTHIRRALGCAIHRSMITKQLKGSSFCFKPFSPSISDTIDWDGNIALAQDFFREGLKELGIERDAFPKLTLYWSGPGEELVVQLIQEQIKLSLNIDIELKHTEWNDLSYLLDRRQYQMATCYRSVPYFYSRSYLELFQESSDLYNPSQWESATYRQYLDKALRTLCPEEREINLAKAEQLLLKEMPVIPVMFPEYRYLLSPKIDKATIASNGDVDLKSISLRKLTS